MNQLGHVVDYVAQGRTGYRNQVPSEMQTGTIIRVDEMTDFRRENLLLGLQDGFAKH